MRLAFRWVHFVVIHGQLEFKQEVIVFRVVLRLFNICPGEFPNRVFRLPERQRLKVRHIAFLTPKNTGVEATFDGLVFRNGARLEERKVIV